MARRSSSRRALSSRLTSSKSAALASFALATFIPAPPSHGEIIPLSQLRRVSASANANPYMAAGSNENAADTAVDLGPFDQTSTASRSVVEMVPGFSQMNSIEVTGSASQSSQILPTRLSASGRLEASSFDVLGGAGDASAQTLYQVTFSVEEPQEYHLTYQADAGVAHDLQLTAETFTNLSAAGVKARRSSRKGLLAAGDGSGNLLEGPGAPLTFDGILQPGTYTLRLMDQLETADGAKAANYVMEFDVVAVPLPAGVWMGLSGLVPVVLLGMRPKRRVG